MAFPTNFTQFQLKQGDTLLGSLEVQELDFPWVRGVFIPTVAFDAVKHLFERELQLLEDEAWDEWEVVYAEITALNLRLVDLASEQVIDEFLLHIDGRDAWFRY